MKARRTTREEVLKTKPASCTDRVPLVTTILPYNIAYRRGRNLSRMLTNKRLPPSDSSDPLYFTIDNDTSNPLETTCKICGCSFHTNRNLKISFSHKHKHQTQARSSSPGFWPCQADSRCACCKAYGKFTRTVTSTTTGETIILAGHIACQTSNVIYILDRMQQMQGKKHSYCRALYKLWSQTS